MHWLVLNGSPRGKGSNSRKLIERMVAGMQRVADQQIEIGYLRDVEEHPRLVEKLLDADAVLVVMPLYADAMPAIVKLFIERLDGLATRERRPKLGFVVQSGFPESCQSEPLARWLEKLTRRLGCESLGIAVRGGVESLRMSPESANRALLESFERLGHSLAQNGRFDEQLLAELARLRRLPAPARVIFSVIAWLGLADLGWNKELKRRGAFERRYDRPHSA